MVQLKAAKAFLEKFRVFKFQFLMVQLKALFIVIYHREKLISIPYGSIKSISVMKLKQTGSTFQFLMVQLKDRHCRRN